MSQVKLNLGCGLFPFPYERGNEPNQKHVLPLPDFLYEDGWINADKHQSAGVQERINLFQFPWIKSSDRLPFEDNSIDVIWAAHLVEHIPHEVKTSYPMPSEMAARYIDMCENLDGFFMFFAEAWRILKPHSAIHIRFPYATCYASLSDPTHTRYLTPGSFGYLSGNDASTPFDYRIPAKFEVTEAPIVRVSGDWVKKMDDYTPEAMMKLLQYDYGIADEIRMILWAVK